MLMEALFVGVSITVIDLCLKLGSHVDFVRL